jgi:DNA polymerase IV
MPDGLALPEKQLVALLGERRGAWLYRRMRGIDDTPVAVDDVARSCPVTRRSRATCTTTPTCAGSCGELVRRLGADLRADGLRARTITVRIRDADFRTRQASRTVDEAVETDRGILRGGAAAAAAAAAERRTGARLLGVAASNLRPGEATQRRCSMGRRAGDGP